MSFEKNSKNRGAAWRRRAGEILYESFPQPQIQQKPVQHTIWSSDPIAFNRDWFYGKPNQDLFMQCMFDEPSGLFWEMDDGEKEDKIVFGCSCTISKFKSDAQLTDFETFCGHMSIQFGFKNPQWIQKDILKTVVDIDYDQLMTYVSMHIGDTAKNAEIAKFLPPAQNIYEIVHVNSDGLFAQFYIFASAVHYTDSECQFICLTLQSHHGNER